MRQRLREYVFADDSPPRRDGGTPPARISERITASFGVASYPSREITSADLLIRYADEALYRAKRQRDAICLYQSQAYRYDAGSQ